MRFTPLLAVSLSLFCGFSVALLRVLVGETAFTGALCTAMVGVLAGWKVADMCGFLWCVLWTKCEMMYAMRQKSPVKVTRRQHIPGWKRFLIARSQDFRCAECWFLLPETFHIDHRRPLKYYGVDDEFNWHALCPTCHDAKTVIRDNALATFPAQIEE